MDSPLLDSAVYELPLYPLGSFFSDMGVGQSTSLDTYALCPAVRDIIVDTVNVVSAVGLPQMLEGTAALFTPSSSVYSTTSDDAWTDHLHREAKFAFMFMHDPADIANLAGPRGITHVVAFSIVTKRPFHSLALAFMLLRFMDAQPLGDWSERFKLRNICFRFSGDVVHGAMYFDRKFQDAYIAVGEAAIIASNAQATMLERDVPVVAWHTTCADFGHGGIARHVHDYLRLTLDMLVPGRLLDRLCLEAEYLDHEHPNGSGSSVDGMDDDLASDDRAADGAAGRATPDAMDTEEGSDDDDMDYEDSGEASSDSSESDVHYTDSDDGSLSAEFTSDDDMDSDEFIVEDDD